MKDIIERIRELPDGENIYISKDGGSNYPYPTKLTTDDLKQMAEELEGCKEMLAAATQIRSVPKFEVEWSLEQFGDDWFAYSKNPPSRHPDALSAFRSLQEKS